MEVMSMLLLCAFVAPLPQTLGVSRAHRIINTDLRYNSSVWVENNLLARRHRVLNINAPPLVNVVTELQAVFMDYLCRNCINCMERVLRSQSRRTFMISSPYPDNLYYDVKNENFHVNQKFKRSIKNNTNRTLSNVTLTQFSDSNGKIYAIKVTELNNQIPQKETTRAATNSTCKVYTVKKTLSCGSRKSDLISPKSKVNKKGRKSKDTISTTQKSRIPTTQKSRLISMATKKPNVESTQGPPPEGYMPSIEEFY